MNHVVTAAVAALLTLALIAATDILPSAPGGGPTLWPAGGVLIAAALVADPAAAAASAVVLVVGALKAAWTGDEHATLLWIVHLAGPLVVALAIRVRGRRVEEPRSADAVPVLAAAVVVGLIAAGLAAVLGLPGGPMVWAMAEGLGVLLAAPLTERLLLRLRPPRVVKE